MTDRATESSSEILRQVRRIEIKTRGLSNDIFAGKYHSAFKGRGMAFSEVREYRMGDDVRDIDWNVTARYVRPYVKVFEEERELTVMLLIDVSGSLDFGTSARLGRDLVAENCRHLGFSRPSRRATKWASSSSQTASRSSSRPKKAAATSCASSANC